MDKFFFSSLNTSMAAPNINFFFRELANVILSITLARDVFINIELDFIDKIIFLSIIFFVSLVDGKWIVIMSEFLNT